MIQLYVCVYTYIPCLLDLPPGPPSHPRLPALGHPGAPSELPGLYSRFPLAVCFTHSSVYTHQVFLVAQTLQNLPAVQEALVRSLGQEGPPEKGMATHSRIPAWRIP